jgi:hypothetical protein
MLGDHEIFLEFRPGHIYNRIPELELTTKNKVPPKVLISTTPAAYEWNKEEIVI